jgi:hypothetical protein
VPLIEPTGDYVFIFEDLELAFKKEQLNQITYHWNNGREIEEIARLTKRHPQEILLALIDLARKRRIKRPFAFRRVKHGKE